jgi:hypothetical protein
MRRPFASLLVLVLAACSTTCFNSTTVVRIKPDGSGTVEQTLTMNPETLQQMAGMMGAMVSGAKVQGGLVKAKGPTSGDDILTKVKARKMAAKMGEGVRFVSRTPIKTPTAEGAKVVFAFDDINKVAVNETASPGGKSGSREDPVVFKWRRASRRPRSRSRSPSASAPRQARRREKPKETPTARR